MLNGWYKGERTGSGTIVWRARELLAAGEIDYQGFIKLVASSAPSTGYCNTMGTATTMNSLTEALGMSLPGSAAIPAPYRDRQECAYLTGKQIVEMVAADRKPSDILTREAFINAIRVNSAIGGSTNAPIHLNALARHIGVELTLDDWQTYGLDIPLLVNLQPAGEYLGEDYYRAGGVPGGRSPSSCAGADPRSGADGQRPHASARTAATRRSLDSAVIRPFDEPLKQKAGFTVLRGNLFDSAIMKTSVISDEFRARYLANPGRSRSRSKAAPSCSTDRRTITRASTIPRSGIDDQTLLFMRGTGPIGYPGAAEVVNMRPPAALIKAGIHHLPCIGDGRQSGTSGSPSILNASPEAAAGGGLALLRTGDRVRIDLRRGEANMLVSDEELQQRRRELEQSGGYPVPPNQTPWQEIQRGCVGQLDTGAVLESPSSISVSRRQSVRRGTITERRLSRQERQDRQGSEIRFVDSEDL